MSTEQMRRAVSKVYGGHRWGTKVAHMSDQQVIAIYYRFLNDKKLKK